MPRRPPRRANPHAEARERRPNFGNRGVAPSAAGPKLLEKLHPYKLVIDRVIEAEISHFSGTEITREDIIQLVNLKFVSQPEIFGTIQTDKSPQAFIAIIVRNLMRDAMRKVARRKDRNNEKSREAGERETDSRVKSPGDEMEMREQFERAWKVARQILNKSQIRILEMSILQGIPETKIAEQLEMNYETVRWNKSFALKKIRKFYRE